jgi:hypothetical protein
MEPALLAPRSKTPSVSALLFTHEMTDEIAAWFLQAKELVDELVIFVDCDKASAESRARAARIGSRMFEISGRNTPEIRAEMVSRCESDWILRLDSDEELSPEWRDGRWRQLLGSPEFTQFYLPRRWMINPSEFLDREPWWPDLSLRLFRKDCAIAFPANVHDQLQVRGCAGYCRSLAINHHVLHMLSRAEREEKVRSYELLRPGEAAGHYYLFEEYAIPAIPVPPPVVVDISTELLGMSPALTKDDMQRVSLAASGFPKSVKPDEFFWLRAVITNNGSETLSSCLLTPSSTEARRSYPVHLTYHWLDANLRTPVVFEGNRSRLFPDVAPGTTLNTSMIVRAPAREGSFLLQVTLVQENVRWFEDECPEIVQEAGIHVKG